MEQAFNRLQQAIDYLKDNGKVHKQQDIADALGMGKARVSEALQGKPMKFTIGFLKRFARAYSDYINEDWLLTGEGRMEKPAKDTIPHYPAIVEAGILGGDIPPVMSDEIEMEPMISCLPPYDYMIDVKGDSMEPTYFENDAVACRRLYNKDDIRIGRVYVIQTQDNALLKRVLSVGNSNIKVASDNPAYKPFSIDTDTIVSISEVVGSVHQQRGVVRRTKETLFQYLQGVLLEVSDDLSDEEKKSLADILFDK